MKWPGNVNMQPDILPEEKLILDKIQNEYGFKLTRKNQIEKKIVGYVVEGGRIVGLGLCRKKITNIRQVCRVRSRTFFEQKGSI
jgi:hypothetical protein